MLVDKIIMLDLRIHDYLKYLVMIIVFLLLVDYIGFMLVVVSFLNT